MFDLHVILIFYRRFIFLSLLWRVFLMLHKKQYQFNLSVFKRRVSSYNKNNVAKNDLMILEIDNMLGNYRVWTVNIKMNHFYLIGFKKFLWALVWDWMITQNIVRSPCMQLYCILNFDLSLSLSLSLSREEHNLRNTCYFFLLLFMQRIVYVPLQTFVLNLD